MQTGPPSLQELGFLALLTSLCAPVPPPVQLGLLPEDLCLSLLQGVLASGRLSPRVVALFLSTGHDLVLQQIQALNLRDPQPLIPDTRNPWLGDERRRW
ncbi:MAG: hypothetical protein J3K34DRAFT_465454 [Monoraphidium minutum]|nr:MAG: hypothetical protein J3K34DRAFT_465454 [Monoraphidium minutum]